MTIFVSSADVDEPLDLVSVGHFVRDDHRFLWLRPGVEDGIIAWGEIGQWSGHHDLTAPEFVATVTATMPQTPQPPLIVGGFCFDSKKPSSDIWADFGPGRLIVPATQIIRRQGRTVVQTFGTDRESANARLTEATEMIRLARDRGLIEFEELTVTIDDYTADHYYGIVKRAIEAIEAGGLDKVVLARAIDIVGAIPLGAWLAALRARFGTCAVFARGEGPRTFFGASPEVLVRVDNERVYTAALAGTRSRGDTVAVDRALADELLRSPKEQAEHTFVLDEIRARLEKSGVDLDASPPTRVMAIPGIQHVYTPITGRREPETSILDLVSNLHPTPAIGGSPNQAALDWIRDHEDLHRGWYGAPVGWTDTSGQGEFRVGLRSGLHGPQGTRLFAGCGIVAESDPEDELEETRTKFNALLSCLGRQ